MALSMNGLKGSSGLKHQHPPLLVPRAQWSAQHTRYTAVLDGWKTAVYSGRGLRTDDVGISLFFSVSSLCVFVFVRDL